MSPKASGDWYYSIATTGDALPCQSKNGTRVAGDQIEPIDPSVPPKPASRNTDKCKACLLHTFISSRELSARREMASQIKNVRSETTRATASRRICRLAWTCRVVVFDDRGLRKRRPYILNRQTRQRGDAPTANQTAPTIDRTVQRLALSRG